MILGLTGSIGMGKSTTAQMFAEEGVPIWDADAAVHRLYAPGGDAVARISAVFPQAISEDGGVSRDALKEIIAADILALAKLEEIVHPLVHEDRTQFVKDHRDQEFVLLDMPLLFETSADKWLDHVICVSAPPELQRERVMARPGMTTEQFESILARQIPNSEKCERADTVIETHSLDTTRKAVSDLMQTLRAQISNA